MYSAGNRAALKASQNYTSESILLIVILQVLCFWFFETKNLLVILLISFSPKAQGFHSEIEDFLLELTRMESQLSAAKPTGGLPETAREQLDAHMVMVFCEIEHKQLIFSIPLLSAQR